MSLGNLDFEAIAEGDLSDLINAEVPEGLTVEYKRDMYETSDAERREALKDVSSFANSFGGHIIIGIEESGGIPTKIAGLHNIDHDAHIQRLESLIRDGIEPRITGVKIRAITTTSDGSVMVIRIPRSWNPPHRVRTGNVNRFYVRNSSGVHEASVDELRVLFNLSSTAHDRVRSFRIERLAMLAADEGPVKIEHGGRLILHIVPLSAFGYAQQIDVKKIFERHSSFEPLSSAGMSVRFNFDGVINFRGGERCHGYTQVFRSGVVEATKADIVRVTPRDGRKRIPSKALVKHIVEALPVYLNGLKGLDISPPLVVMVSLAEVHGVHLGVERQTFDDDESYAFDKSELLLPEIVLEDYGPEQHYQKAMRPAFDALWNAAGFVESPYFDKNDIWIGETNSI